MKLFTRHLERISEERNCGILTPPTTDREVIYFLKNYLLGEDWYVCSPIGHEQCNTEIIHAILMKYSRQYRKEYRRYLKIGERRRNKK